MRLSRLVVLGLLLLAPVVPARAQTKVAGDWHGVLQSPIGPMTLIITIVQGEDGVLRGEMESPDQGPRKTPLTTVTAAGGRLAFTVRPAQISFEGEWVDAGQEWSGVFLQGTKIPLTLRRGTPPRRPVIEGVDGLWQGVVTRNGVDLRLVLRIATGVHGTVVIFDSPDLGATGLPVTGFSRQGAAVGFVVPASGARYAGSLSDDGLRLRGIWALPGQPEVEVTFVRTGASAQRERAPRPQVPKPPFPYRAEEVTFENPAAKGVTLAGTLTLPAGAGPFAAAVLITGSGPQDRDETLLGHQPFAVLADHLSRQGLAVLRYDDRGVGASTGEFAAATSADFATDAAAAVRFLRTRADIDREAIGLIGHSEGGMVAPLAAAGNSAVRFVVLLAGPGTDLIRLAQSQQRLLGLSQGVAEETLARMEPVLAGIFAAVARSASPADARSRVRTLLTPDALTILRTPELQREALVEHFAGAWFRYFLQYKPAALLSRIQVPVLAVNGSLDLQVPADDNLAAIRTALAHNPDVTIRKLDGLNHMFQPARTGAIGEYADIAETMSPVVLDLVADWIAARFPRQ